MIDGLDKKLIALLARQGRISTAEVAKRTGVSRATASSRIKSLIDDGVLKTAGLVDAATAGELTTAFVGLKLDEFRLEETVGRVAQLDEVAWAAVVTGRYDILAEVVTDRGMAGLYDFLNTSLMGVGGVASSEMFVVMKASDKWSVLPEGLARRWAAEAVSSFAAD
jgi:Lrp/AsnC family transcriptional regulator for asnA, asnC and gidA